MTGFKLFYADNAKNWKGYSLSHDANKVIIVNIRVSIFERKLLNYFIGFFYFDCLITRAVQYP